VPSAAGAKVTVVASWPGTVLGVADALSCRGGGDADLAVQDLVVGGDEVMSGTGAVSAGTGAVSAGIVRVRGITCCLT
jgi:hypothetical protein